MKISITTNSSALYSFLNADLPNGVKIISEPPMERKGIDIDIIINIDLIVDLTEISVLAFTAWLINRSRRVEGKHNINVYGEQISVDDPEAIELVAKEIEDESQG